LVLARLLQVQQQASTRQAARPGMGLPEAGRESVTVAGGSLHGGAAATASAILQEGSLVFAETWAKLRKATGTVVREQQEVFTKWAPLCPVVPLFTAPLGRLHPFRKEWGEIVGELTRVQCKALEAQFGAGLRAIDEALHLPEAKDCQELSTRTIELWQKVGDSLRQTCDAQVRDCQAVLVKGARLLKGRAFLVRYAADFVLCPGWRRHRRPACATIRCIPL
jgi:hypothetical protein